MSYEALRWAFSNTVLDSMATISTKNGSQAFAHAVLVRLADRAGADNVSFGSYERLARDCCMSRMGVVKAIEKLVETGLVKKRARAAKDKVGGRRATRYELMVVNGREFSDLQTQSTSDVLFDKTPPTQSTFRPTQSTSDVPDPSALIPLLSKKGFSQNVQKGEGVLKLVSDGERRPPQREWHDGEWREPGWHRKGE